MIDYQIKYSMVVASLANEFIGYEIGERIETIQNLAKAYNVGNGTVQEALNYLENVHALKFIKRGYRGTILTEFNYPILAKICGINSILGIMPIPYSIRYEGLATAFHQILSEREININLAFILGANARVNTLLDGRCDFILVSQLSAQMFMQQFPQLDSVMTMHKHSYISAHGLIKRKNFEITSCDTLKIGVDTRSHDQMYMTSQYFKEKKTEMIPIRYRNILDALVTKKIDLTVWSIDNIDLNSSAIEIAEILYGTHEGDETRATILVLKKNVGIKKYLCKRLQVQLIEEIQNAVILGEKTPAY